MEVQQTNNSERREYTADEKREHRMKNIQRYRAAYEEAIAEITKNADIKITDAVFENKDTAVLYTFHYMKEKDAQYDSNGKKIIFGDNIHLLDMVTKGRDYFFRELEKKFNKRGSERRTYCGVFKDINPNGDNINRWNIFVSWRSQERKFNTKKNNNERVATAVIVDRPNQQQRPRDTNNNGGQRREQTKSTGPKEGSWAYMAAKKSE